MCEEEEEGNMTCNDSECWFCFDEQIAAREEAREGERKVMARIDNAHSAWKLRTETDLGPIDLRDLIDEIIAKSESDVLRGKLREELDALADYIRNDIKICLKIRFSR